MNTQNTKQPHMRKTKRETKKMKKLEEEEIDLGKRFRKLETALITI